MTTNEHLTEAELNRAPFAAGDIVVLHDRRRRRYRIPLRAGGRYSSHLGAVDHDAIIGQHEGFVIRTNRGHNLTALRPTFRERVMDLPRQSQVVYPKDLGALLMWLDLYPGAHVIECGLGSGAASSAILRAVGATGSLVSYEVRGEIVGPAKANIRKLVGEHHNHTVVVADAYEAGFAERDVDRVLLDLAEPWRLADAAAATLRLGGVVAAFMPTVLQVHQMGMALSTDARWRLIETVELIERPWHVTDVSVRPEHRMVGHTGFIMTARRCEPAGEPEAAVFAETPSSDDVPAEDSGEL